MCSEVENILVQRTLQPPLSVRYPQNTWPTVPIRMLSLGNVTTMDSYVLFSIFTSLFRSHFGLNPRGGIPCLFTILFCPLVFSESPQIKIDGVGGGWIWRRKAISRSRERERGGQSFYREALEKDSVGAMQPVTWIRWTDATCLEAKSFLL